MNFLSMRELRTQTAAIKTMLSNDGSIVVTNNGKPAALMIDINEDNFEDVLTDLRKLRAKRAIRLLQKQSEKAGMSGMQMEEIDAVVAAARRARTI
ncbi:MAG: type II toxin-antitoxin system Phd/YefM family antitoxin [Clostridiales Family XIII bacterium]|nr:type II toxin-antitoxin system Phd/YefM family antitoxin [Clostridiales Family XIII bacterium]